MVAQECHGAFGAHAELVAESRASEDLQLARPSRTRGLTTEVQQHQDALADGCLRDQRCGVEGSARRELCLQAVQHRDDVREQVQHAETGHCREGGLSKRQIEEVACTRTIRDGSWLRNSSRWAARVSMPSERSTSTSGRSATRYASAVNTAVPHPTSSMGPSPLATAAAAKVAYEATEERHTRRL